MTYYLFWKINIEFYRKFSHGEKQFQCPWNKILWETIFLANLCEFFRKKCTFCGWKVLFFVFRVIWRIQYLYRQTVKKSVKCWSNKRVNKFIISEVMLNFSKLHISPSTFIFYSAQNLMLIHQVMYTNFELKCESWNCIICFWLMVVKFVIQNFMQKVEQVS